jgi:hypothetical protein
VESMFFSLTGEGGRSQATSSQAGAPQGALADR